MNRLYRQHAIYIAWWLVLDIFCYKSLLLKARTTNTTILLELNAVYIVILASYTSKKTLYHFLKKFWQKFGWKSLKIFFGKNWVENGLRFFLNQKFTKTEKHLQNFNTSVMHVCHKAIAAKKCGFYADIFLILFTLKCYKHKFPSLRSITWYLCKYCYLSLNASLFA